jgi:hypothetical protein
MRLQTELHDAILEVDSPNIVSWVELEKIPFLVSYDFLE